MLAVHIESLKLFSRSKRLSIVTLIMAIKVMHNDVSTLIHLFYHLLFQKFNLVLCFLLCIAVDGEDKNSSLTLGIEWDKGCRI